MTKDLVLAEDQHFALIFIPRFYIAFDREIDHHFIQRVLCWVSFKLLAFIRSHMLATLIRGES